MNLREYNKEVKSWTLGTRRKMKTRVLQLVTARGPADQNLYSQTKAYAGEINKLGFSFPYYMVFVHKGAGRGYGGIKTALFTNAKGGKGITNPKSMGKMGTGKRRPKPWFNPVIESNFPQLENIIVDYRAEKVILKIQNILID